MAAERERKGGGPPRNDSYPTKDNYSSLGYTGDTAKDAEFKNEKLRVALEAKASTMSPTRTTDDSYSPKLFAKQ